VFDDELRLFPIPTFIALGEAHKLQSTYRVCPVSIQFVHGIIAGWLIILFSAQMVLEQSCKLF
jgi:hypothetical protein